MALDLLDRLSGCSIMLFEEYWRKRDFGKTSDPRGKLDEKMGDIMLFKNIKQVISTMTSG